MGAPKKYATDEEFVAARRIRSKAYKQTVHGRAQQQRGGRRYGWKRNGIDPDAAEAMLAANDGTCDACGAELTAGQGTHVDHDHALPITELNPPRGILCPGCNQALGNINDSVERLRALIAYMEARS